MKTTIGGDRIGSGNKMQVDLKTYNRSTHDLSYLWRSSMSAGTLVPFLNQLALPGDVWEVDLNCEVMTLPTVGPLFGSYKVQLDVFEIPLRLYNAKLHMNKLGVGMDMSNIFLPQVEVWTNNHANYIQTFDDNEHINPSCLLKYLGISGLGRITASVNPAKRTFNACSLLAYWDVYKNYYSSKQEGVGYYIHSDGASQVTTPPISAQVVGSGGELKGDVWTEIVTLVAGDDIYINLEADMTPTDVNGITFLVNGSGETADNLFSTIIYDKENKHIHCNNFDTSSGTNVRLKEEIQVEVSEDVFGLVEFDLENIDSMREDILQYAGASAFTINASSPAPYNCFVQSKGLSELLKYSCQFSQEGLAIKTYQSDLFNNWLDTEWIDGTGGVNEITAVSTVGDEFTIDALNLAQKVYVMLNRIAISGGTYDDWLDAVYTHERVKGIESPVYHGSLIKELAFEEVISNAQTNDQPLGTLAGRGRLTGKNKGGKMLIKTNEPAVLLGLCSLTPRVEYSQGNDWTVNLKSYDDFHKPELGAIGFQELVAEQMLWTDSEFNSDTKVVTQHSVGKQPAWINYMTNVNKTYGNFAVRNKEMFMTLNRRYEAGVTGLIQDATTYIDPTKYNQIFAETNIDAQNFWTQISVGLIARRKMSAVSIPNL